MVKPEPTTFKVDAETSITDAVAQQHFYQAYQPFKNSDLVEFLPGSSEKEVEVFVRAVYRQVLGNAYVMESEHYLIPESRLKLGEISVREFVRQIAKSELYRSRFFENCYWYRAMELNFKHLLGHAPDNFAEMRYYSSVLDEGEFAASIDAFLDSDEYQNAFGENIVPYYRGYKTQNGQSLLGFTNMFQLLRSASSSDKDLVGTNGPRTTKGVIWNKRYGKNKPAHAQDILAKVFAPKPQSETTAKVDAFALARKQAEEGLQQQVEEQQGIIARLQQQLSELRPVASIAASQFNPWESSGTTSAGIATASSGAIDTYTALQRQIEDQEKANAYLQEKIADARPLATIGEYKLNKWRSRSF
ncbi:MAG: phycobilisome rod-core linker polypeptide [Richelia sp.]|nr:phycobilisome rod-core linker polypeptide [Richelia sp.]